MCPQERGHVVLILDKQLQSLPWETIDILKHHSVSRLPSIDTLLWLLKLTKYQFFQQVDFNSVSYVVNPKVSLYLSDQKKILLSFKGCDTINWKFSFRLVGTWFLFFFWKGAKKLSYGCLFSNESKFVNESLNSTKNREFKLIWNDKIPWKL